MSQGSKLAALRSIYPDDMVIIQHCVPPREELIKWSAECLGRLAYVESLGNDAHCYIKGGMAAVENIRQFAGYAALWLGRP